VTVNTWPRRRPLIVWLLLSAITLAYLALDRAADHQGTYRASSVVTTVAILLALVKARYIFREFMQVRNAPALLRRLTDLWVLLIGAALLGSYFAGLAIH
jgi:Prokaryotic Cytochrome C oxidase subunit IV